ncbi:hypothetical protein DICVIV_14313 [Dictyocaulus viviparus]|uniref:Uncharacterized protein n=1 Tax=Dictyocaulus viviparus TaxID=29172 RepID=A0A0D8X5P5_DICVI|nr:hypothetical protein DICVIV_14313 [Dictyocaulus viviparus]
MFTRSSPFKSFLDDYVYSVKTFGDLTDGVVLGKRNERKGTDVRVIVQQA